MKTRVLLVVLLVVSLGINAGAIIVLAKQGRTGKVVKYGWRCNALRGGYHLTGGQAEALEKSRQEMIDRTARIRGDLRLRRRALLDLYRRDSVAEPALDSVLGLLVVDQVALEKEVLRHICEVRRQLDPGQREILYRHMTEELCPGLKEGCSDQCPHQNE